MVFIFEVILQIILELIFQLLGEALAELGLRSLSESYRKQANPILAPIGFALLGAIFGGISLWLLPNAMLSPKALQLANLALTPVAAGLTMVYFEKWLARRDRRTTPLAKFMNAYLLAFAFAIVRFVWTS